MPNCCTTCNTPLTDNALCSQCAQQPFLAGYRVIRPLSQSTSDGLVEAVEEGLERRCVLRRLTPTTPTDLARVVQQAQILADPQHRPLGLPAVYGILNDGEDQYLAVEYIDGPTLDRKDLHPHGWSLLDVEAFVCSGLKQLAGLHKLGLLCNTITPHNVAQTGSAHYTLLDPGMSTHRLVRATDTNDEIFLAPERRCGEQGTVRSDLYSLAATARSLLSQPTSEQRSRASALEKIITWMLAEEPSQRPASAQVALWALRLPALVMMVCSLLLALIPVLLVVADRWLNQSAVEDGLKATWCSVKLLCDLSLPSYFLLVIPCFLGLLLLHLIYPVLAEPMLPADPPVLTDPPEAETRVQQVARRTLSGALLWVVTPVLILLAATLATLRGWPGWPLASAIPAFALGIVLRDTPLTGLTKLWQQRSLVANLVVVHLVLIAFLTSFYGSGQGFVLLAALLGIVTLRLALRQQTPPIFWVASLALVLYTLGINAWWFAVIGDEYEFYYQARSIALNQTPEQVGSLLFSAQGAYGLHPFFSSALQALSLKILGNTNFGWRFSNLYAAMIGLVGCWFCFNSFVRKSTALTAALLLAGSHFLMSMGKIGSNNLQALAILGLSLAAATWAIRSRRISAFALTGITLGLCFYLFPGSLYVLPVTLLLLLVYVPPLSRPTLFGWATMILTTLALITPLLFQPAYWQGKVMGTLFFRPEITQTATATIYHFLTNGLYSLFSFLYTPDEAHFIAVGYMDPLGALLLPIGIAALFSQLRQRRFAVFLLLSFAGVLFMAGMTHDRDLPSASRMFMLLPWYTLFAAMGLTWLLDQGRRMGLAERPTQIIGGLVIAATLALNLYQAYPLSKERMGRYQMPQILLLGIVQQAFEPGEANPLRIVLLNPPQQSLFYPSSLRELFLLYGVPFQSEQLVEVVMNGPQISPADQELISNPRTLVIINPQLDPATSQWLTDILANSLHYPCKVHTPAGEDRFTLWLSGDTNYLCENVVKRL